MRLVRQLILQTGEINMLLKYNHKNEKGLSLVEILVVISVFAVIGILSTRSIFLTLRGAKKSDSLVRVRENVNYAMGVIERQIRNSESIESLCDSIPSSSFSYIAEEGVSASFTCEDMSGDGYIASSGARLTSSDIDVTSCSFTCTQLDPSDPPNYPPTIKISISAEDTVSTSVEKGTVTSETEIIARNY